MIGLGGIVCAGFLLKFRKKYSASIQNVVISVLRYFIISIMLSVLGYMFFLEQYRYEMIVTLLFAGFILLMSFCGKIKTVNLLY